MNNEKLNHSTNVPAEISFKDDSFSGDVPVDLKIRILSEADTTRKSLSKQYYDR